ncbi:Sensitivity To Red Light Reduced-like SRR1 [Trinorchestia longiramus]|nr:Sensitivity To Red Light Reduced-like SRR1 [Trinorchestia longiramus]
MEDDQPFIYVKNKRNKNKLSTSNQLNECLNYSLPYPKLVSNVQQLYKHLDRTVSSFIVKAVTSGCCCCSSGGGGEIKQILSYGLGSPSTNRNSRTQLAVLLQVSTALECPKTLLYDPVFEPGDIKLLNDYKLSVMNRNEECFRSVQERTIFYMPHCCWAMYNNVLWANWTPSKLRHVIIVGNNICNAVAQSDSVFKTTYKFISAILDKELFEVRALPSLKKCNDALVDSAVIVFHSDKFPSDKTFWQRGPKPEYKGAHFGELIEKTKSSNVVHGDDNLDEALQRLCVSQT